MTNTRCKPIGWGMMQVMIAICCCFSASAQCVLSPFQAHQYGQVSCGAYIFQYAAGGQINTYGDCGGLTFTSPLTDDDVTTSTDPASTLSALIWFPNPTPGVLQLRTDIPVTGLCQVHTIEGRLIRQDFLSAATGFDLDLTDYAPGYYLIITRLESGQRIIQKIIKSN